MIARRILSGIVLLTLLALLFAGCQAADEDEELPAAPTPDGAVVFTENCAGCHGQGGDGGSIGPAIRPSAKTADELFAIIAAGVSGTAMPAYRGRIGEAEVRGVIAYLQQK